ncbi:VOC family protein [Acidocella sp.]|uniref:VOC family protein n=1 Tax=Acidocella sp. TaxID=50710 RepID=UPI003D0816A1
MPKPVHMMIRVLDEARSTAFYAAAFGMTPSHRLAFDTFTLVYLRNAQSPFEIELTINHGRTEPYDPGNGYGHLAFVVEDLESEHARLRAAGLAPLDIKQFDRHGEKLARFFFIEDPDGYRIEILEHYGHYR